MWQTEGLEMHTASDVAKVENRSGDGHRLVEVVISSHSDLIGHTPRAVQFRTLFNAAIVAIHRHGEHMTARIGDVPLRSGDTLLLVTGPGFAARFRSAKQFALISELGLAAVPPKVVPWRIALVTLIAIAMIVVSSVVDSISLFVGGLAASFLYWALGVLTVKSARDSVDMSVMVMVAASIGIAFFTCALRVLYFVFFCLSIKLMKSYLK